jgi:hypothetical protein
MLERDGGEIARATSIVRYAERSSFSEHVHERGEEFIVLDGTFSDEHGSYPKGTYVRNPPSSRHRPFSAQGCTIFVKLRQFDMGDTRRCVVRLEDGSVEDATSTSTLLHTFGNERVSLVRLGRGASIDLRGSGCGVELFVLRGAMHVGSARCGVWTWLRAPHATASIDSRTGCDFWLKQGHLPHAPTST